MKVRITGLVLTYNGERLLEHCLASLAFCDRILVVDSCSTDATTAIATRCGAVVVQRPWEGAGAQFRYAFDLLDTEYPTEWVVSLDQDELCTPELQRAIVQAIEGNAALPNPPAGYWIPRRSWYYDRFLLHSGWYPDRLLRCFRHGQSRVSVSGAHYSIHPQGTTAHLTGDIVHYPYANFRQHLDKINAYAQEGADALAAQGHSGGIAAGLLHGVGRFMRIYLLKRGFLDGKAGFINALHGAFYAFLKYVRVHEGTWGAPYSLPEHKNQTSSSNTKDSREDVC